MAIRERERKKIIKRHTKICRKYVRMEDKERKLRKQKAGSVGRKEHYLHRIAMGRALIARGDRRTKMECGMIIKRGAI